MKLAILGSIVVLALRAPIEEPVPLPLDSMTKGGGERVTWNTALYDTFRQSVSYSVGDTAITISRCERADSQPTTEWASVEMKYSTDLRLTSIAYRDGGDQIILAGVSSLGVSSIVSWKFQVPDGSHVARSSAQSNASTSSGSSIGFSSSLGIQGGGAFSFHAGSGFPCEKLVIYQDAALGFVQAIAADPEGRMVIAKFYPSNELYKFDLTSATPTKPIKLYTPTDIPHLSDIKHLVFRDHAQLGRVLVMDTHCKRFVGEPSSPYVTLLVDTNNDGAFENVTTMTHSEWFSTAAMTTKTMWNSFFGT